MQVVIYSKSGDAPGFIQGSPHKINSTIISGENQSSAMLKYMIEQHTNPVKRGMVMLHSDSTKTMVRDTGYDLDMAITIVSCHFQKSLFEGFWPIGCIGFCDHEGYPHAAGLPIKRMFEIANLRMPSVIPFIFDQSFAIRIELATSIPKATYEALLTCKDSFGDLWEPCMVRIWYSLYRNSKTSFL